MDVGGVNEFARKIRCLRIERSKVTKANPCNQPSKQEFNIAFWRVTVILIILCCEANSRQLESH